MKRVGLVLVFLMGAVGCDSTSPEDAGQPDAGVVEDSGMPTDAGDGPDAGFDAGVCATRGQDCLAMPCCAGLACTGSMGGDGGIVSSCQ